ncbi:MAG TPA: NifB/NifX family molybdenum-iron cluster-binding protein [Anaerolineales bacterium]|nr:NifB/NifX family molybdenum-iron cluster-binding protein [Anaerolineales bacterium]
MRVVVTAENEKGLQSPVSGHFGHAAYFTIIEVNEGKIGEVSVHANPHVENHKPGQVPIYINSLNANVIITGGMGESAAKVFDKVGIEAYTTAFGTVEQAITAYLEGKLHPALEMAHLGRGGYEQHNHDHNHQGHDHHEHHHHDHDHHEHHQHDHDHEHGQGRGGVIDLN